ncbi:hypothetical protein YC2023_010630 [Brassica napus]
MIGSNKVERSSARLSVHAPNLVKLDGKGKLQYCQIGHAAMVPAKAPFRTYAGRSSTLHGQSVWYGEKQEPRLKCLERPELHAELVTLIPGELENGLDLVSEFLEDGTNTLEQDKINEDLDSSREEGMELGETDHTTTETDAGLELADEFQNLTDGEGKDMDQVEAKEFVEEDMTSGIAEGMVTAAAEKMPGLRKPLFSVAGGNNSNGLKGQVRMSDAVSSMQLDVSGRQAKDLVHVWFVGIGMWLKTERNILVAWTQALWLWQQGLYLE